MEHLLFLHFTLIDVYQFYLISVSKFLTPPPSGGIILLLVFVSLKQMWNLKFSSSLTPFSFYYTAIIWMTKLSSYFKIRVQLCSFWFLQHFLYASFVITRNLTFVCVQFGSNYLIINHVIWVAKYYPIKKIHNMSRDI